MRRGAFPVVAVLIVAMLVGVYPIAEPARAEITCLNSDRNCIYFEVGNTGNRIVCTRSVCGGGSFGGKQWQLEGVYAFDGPNPNDATTTSSSTTSVVATSTTVTSESSTTSTSTSSSSSSVPTVSSSTTSLVATSTTVASSTSTSGSSTSSSSSTTSTQPQGGSSDDTYERICRPLGWTSCGEYEILDSDGVVINRVIGSDANDSGRDSLGDGWGPCNGNSNGCRAVKVGTVRTDATTTTIATAASSSTTTASSTTTTTVAAGTGSTNPCLRPGYACGWAMLDSNNRVTNVIVCTFEVCGGGTWAGQRVVLQTQQSADGNVAGWRDSTYVESSKSFALPGGGTIRSGDKIEEAVFPTTTTTTQPQSTTTLDGSPSTTAPSTTTTAAPSPVTVERIVTEEKREYATVDRYVAGETQIVETDSQIVVQLPELAPSLTDIVVSFDPDGPEVERVVAVLDAPLPNTNDGPRATSRAVRAPIRVIVPRSALRGQSGRLIARMSLPGGSKASVTAKLGPVRSYPSCRLLWDAYPGGGSRSLSSRDRRVVDVKASRSSLLASSKRRKPVVNLVSYRLNIALDTDRDGIACERD